MTSTNIHVGLEGAKNSSRVLRAPGGGHTDIFGVKGNINEIETPSKRRNHPPSTITTCFMHEDGEPNKTKTESKDEPKDEIKEVENNEDSKINVDENTEPKKDEENVEVDNGSKPQSLNTRVRVPPGGFSSRLW